MKKFEKEEARRVAEEEAMKAYPFSPTVPTPPPPANPEAVHPAPTLPVFERLLSNNKKFMQSVLSQVSVELELEPCTFKPTVDDPMAEKRAHEGPVYERLLKDDAKARHLLEIKQEEALLRELDTLKVRIIAYDATNTYLTHRPIFNLIICSNLNCNYDLDSICEATSCHE